jgi:colanic acid biosynthesis glycosyl transferase WcaI
LLPRFDLVIAMTSPPLISWLGAWFATLKGGHFAFWVMDLNPDEAIAAGWLRPGSQTTTLLAGMLNSSLRRATTIIALDEFMATRIAGKGVPASKIVVVPPWSHDRSVRYDDAGRARFREQHRLEGKHVVMYSGNHSPCHPLTGLLEAARQLRARPDIAFCFVGGGSEFEGVRRFARAHALDNVVTIPYQPLEELSASLSAADLHVVVMGEPFVGIVHPCKVYNIRSLGIPYLYIGPPESHVVSMGPTFSARHRDIGAIVAAVTASAEAGTCRTNHSGAASHSQDELVPRLVATLEVATLAPGMRRALGHSRGRDAGLETTRG